MILLVEDNPNDIALTLRAFKKQQANCDVVVVRDGAEALDYLFCTGDYQGRDLDKMPALVLMDLKLPKIDGLEVIRRIREHNSTRFLPVVVLTTSEENTDLLECYSLGINSYIRKPVDSDNFDQVIRNLSLYWLKFNITPKHF
ncbi:response regulator [Cesiribacter sp. SM1]|uniref:response regulator n=1 Tax=Cesiribacter sp. SM1 TaxID=2861196 RepID=UPI001CD6F230|nr:response regulator [Cesiribacter sp. SM1]